MKKYIDSDIVNLKLKQICDNHNTSYGIQFGGRAKDFAQLTDDIPAADVAEIVRCKDCKHWHGGDCFRIELTRPNDFCSFGEKIKEKKEVQE